MQRKEFADYPFDKKKFAEVLSRAFGSKNQREFCEDAGLSISYVSRYVNGKVDSCPTVGTLKKMAMAADGVTYEELLSASGYDPKKYEHDRPRKVRGKDYFYPVVRSVACSDMDWRIDSKGIGDGVPFEITVEREDVRRWFFIPVEKSDITKEEIQNFLLSRSEFSNDSKISFVTDEWETFEKIKTFEFPILSLYLSVIKIIGADVEEEAHLKTSQNTDITVLSNTEKKPYALV